MKNKFDPEIEELLKNMNEPQEMYSVDRSTNSVFTATFINDSENGRQKSCR